nr:hypothetical protein T459_28135 [Ipomoea trifida]
MAMLRYNGADPKQNTAKPKPLAALDGCSGRSQVDTYDRRRIDPHFIAPGERKFHRGLERRGGRKGSGWI